MVSLQSIEGFCWSPDGTKLAGVSRVHGGSYGTERSGIFFVNLDGPYWPTWICEAEPPLGPKIGGAPPPDMFTWYAHGSGQPRRTMKTFANVAWSGDRRTLAFTSDMDPAGAFYVYTFDTDEDANLILALDLEPNADADEVTRELLAAVPIVCDLVHSTRGDRHF